MATAPYQAQTRTLQPPPPIPNVSGLNEQLANYLRSFALWCRHGFADKVSSSTAQPGIMLQAFDALPGTAPPVFMIQVKTDGTIVATPIPLGIGRP